MIVQKRLASSAIGVVILVGLWLAQFVLGPADKVSSEDGFKKVVRVVDGDSLYLEGESRQIRLWGVDAPETDEAGYLSATNSLKQVALGKHVSCTQMDVDHYQRIVARCVLQDGSEINRIQINNSAIKEYCRFSKNFYGTCR